MASFSTSAFLAGLVVSATPVFGRGLNPERSLTQKDIIIRDVAIIGGGAAGIHAAVTLSDLGLSVVVVEKTSDIGGPDVTYVDPRTNIPVNYGVQVFWNDIPETAAFFDRLGVAYNSDGIPQTYNQTMYMDFSTGAVVNGVPPTNLTSFVQQVLRYPELVYTKQVADAIPKDLTLPFGKYAEKYNLDDGVFTLANIYGGDLLHAVSLNVLSAIAADVLPTSAIRPASGFNHEIYDEAFGVIGRQNVLLNSVVTATRQTAGATTSLTVTTPGGNRTIQACHLVITMPTLPRNMGPLSPDARESSVFASFTGQYVYLGLVRISGLPAGQNYLNAQANSPYHLPPAYGLFSLSPTVVDGLFEFFYLSELDTVEAKAKSDVLAGIKTVVKTVTGRAFTQNPTLVASRQIGWRPSMTADAIARGGWKSFYALQGHRNRWYNGLEFLPSSPQIWNYTRLVIAPGIKAAMSTGSCKVVG